MTPADAEPAIDPPAPVDPAGGIDHRRLRQEIDAEVRRLHESGALDPDAERELDRIFARYAPPAALGDDLEALLDQIDRTSFIDVNPSVESARRSATFVKKVQRRVLAWYFRHIAQQVSTLAETIRRALGALDRRLQALEEVAGIHDDELAALLAAVAEPAPDGATPALVAAVAGAPGRVLHAHCGDGELVAALIAAGVDAYGTDPALALTPPGDLDLRADALAEHLAALPAGGLGAIVLSSGAARVRPGSVTRLVAAIGRALADGGRLAIASPTPAHWAAAGPRPLVDLDPARPLHPETWAALLGDGFAVEHEPLAGGAGYLLAAERR